MSTLRRLALRLVIITFALAALMGIAALLLGELGDLQFKVLLTTLAIGLESVVVLCYLAPHHRRFIELGIVGFIVSTFPVAIALMLIWLPDLGNEIIYRFFASSLITAATIAQVCLLASLIGTPRGVVRWVFRLTLFAATAVAVMLIATVLKEGDIGEWFFRLIGVAAICDAFGSVALIAIRLFTGDPDMDRATLDHVAERRLAEVGASAGIPAQQVLDEAIDLHVTRLTAVAEDTATHQAVTDPELDPEVSGDDLGDRQA